MIDCSAMSTSHLVTLCTGGDFHPSPNQLASLEELLRTRDPQVRLQRCASDSWEQTDLSGTTVFFGWPSDEMLARMPELQWVQLPSAGAGAFVRHPHLTDRVDVTTSSGVFGIAGAEHTLALLFAVARDIRRHVEQTAAARWGKHEHSVEIYDATIGVFGLGSIGTEIARRLHALGAHVIGVKRTVSGPVPDYLEELTTVDHADAVLPRCDVVVLAMPETTETQGFLSADRIRGLKDGVLIVNVGRGSAIDQSALVAALHQGHVAGAGLDVTTPEPLPPDDPLWNAPNVIITSHSMNVFDRKDERRFDLFADNFARLVAGEELRNLVDHERGY